MEGLCGNLICNDANFVEILAIHETLLWIKTKQWTKCLILSDSLIVVDCIDGSTRIKDRYNNYTTVCRELMQREGHIQLEKVERGQVQEADILARTSSQREWGVGRWMYSANFV